MSQKRNIIAKIRGDQSSNNDSSRMTLFYFRPYCFTGAEHQPDGGEVGFDYDDDRDAMFSEMNDIMLAIEDLKNQNLGFREAITALGLQEVQGPLEVYSALDDYYDRLKNVFLHMAKFGEHEIRLYPDATEIQ